MSWLARTIANSLRLDEEEDKEDLHNNDDNLISTQSKSELESDPQSPSSSASTPTARGVKEDLSEITKSISRQLWGVASFLAPPPDPDPNPPSEPSDSNATDEDIISGIRSDFEEISGRFRSGISKISGNKTVSEFTKFASNFLQIGSDEGNGLDSVVGLTEEVLAFAGNIAMHPETWLDFPHLVDPDSDDFELSDPQQEHALAVERLVPSLAALRMELCPGYMSDGCFWKIYFVLLHPRLDKSDADILSTSEIVEARAMLAPTLDKRSKENKESDLSLRGNVPSNEEEQHLSVPSSAQLESGPLQTSAVEAIPSIVVTDVEMVKYPVQSTGTHVTDMSVAKAEPVNPTSEQSLSGSVNRFLGDSHETYEDDADDWLKEDTSEMVGPGGTSVPIGNEEDVSFSDLEEEEDDVPASLKKTTSGSDSSTKDSRDWVQLSRSRPNEVNSAESRHADSEHSSARNSDTKDSNDWLNVDDIDEM
ncbi:putative BSD domain-containing protein [Lupinus albus]|uniref:Putative BSD domain-containing protein n=1 Tax=Lupinus albus TaxID=3870 RepID=A0A6A4P5D3_LUPAL|nr:putative BSD domain-containing protein [Lupinus albus]